MNDTLTTQQAADKLGVSRTWVIKLIARGDLPAAKHGRDWQIAEVDLAHMPRRKSGRPRKQEQEAQE